MKTIDEILTEAEIQIIQDYETEEPKDIYIFMQKEIRKLGKNIAEQICKQSIEITEKVMFIAENRKEKNKNYLDKSYNQGYFNSELDFKVGELVVDDLLERESVIKRIETDKDGNIGFFLEDEEWLDSGRFPWEISKIEGGS